MPCKRSTLSSAAPNDAAPAANILATTGSTFRVQCLGDCKRCLAHLIFCRLLHHEAFNRAIAKGSRGFQGMSLCCYNYLGLTQVATQMVIQVKDASSPPALHGFKTKWPGDYRLMSSTLPFQKRICRFSKHGPVLPHYLTAIQSSRKDTQSFHENADSG